MILTVVEMGPMPVVVRLGPELAGDVGLDAISWDLVPPDQHPLVQSGVVPARL